MGQSLECIQFRSHIGPMPSELGKEQVQDRSESRRGKFTSGRRGATAYRKTRRGSTMHGKKCSAQEESSTQEKSGGASLTASNEIQVDCDRLRANTGKSRGICDEGSAASVPGHQFRDHQRMFGCCLLWRTRRGIPGERGERREPEIGQLRHAAIPEFTLFGSQDFSHFRMDGINLCPDTGSRLVTDFQ